jgi:predicted amidohydrolase
MSMTRDAALKHSLANLALLEPHVAKAAADGCQITVLPEYGITGDGTQELVGGRTPFTRDGVLPFTESVPDVGAYPCQPSTPDTLTSAMSTSNTLTSAMACMALKYAIVLAVDCLERVECASCQDGHQLFNTALVFAEDGAIIAKYRKHHLYGPEHHFLDPGPRSNGTSVRTSFGITFGMFICFDILFQTIVSDRIHDFIYPTAWVNEKPFEGATEVQRIWSLVHGKTLLAANYGGFGRRKSGSGIWHRGKALAEFFNPTSSPESRLLIADIPRPLKNLTASA